MITAPQSLPTRPQSQHGNTAQIMGCMASVILIVLLCFSLISLLGSESSKAFWPKKIAEISFVDGQKMAGILVRKTTEDGQKKMLYRLGNADITAEEYRWVLPQQLQEKSLITYPLDLIYAERLAQGIFIGTITGLSVPDGTLSKSDSAFIEKTQSLLKQAQLRRQQINRLEQQEIRKISQGLGRIATNDPAYQHKNELLQQKQQQLKQLQEQDAKHQITLQTINGEEITLPLSGVVRLYYPNQLNFHKKLKVFGARIADFITEPPRDANMAGGIWPAILGTALMTILLSLLITPLGVATALFLREYTQQGILVSLVRLSLRNLAAVPSVVFGVFGLGFFAYGLGGIIDEWFFAERLPTATFGTGGILWSACTMALLTLPIMVVATEEALGSIPNEQRQAAIAMGSTRWQMVRLVLLPQALPGILTGVIMAMARGAGEVAPLVMVGVVKIAATSPIDELWPFIHLERSFMHLGFHIFDVAFQAPDVEMGRPIAFATAFTLLFWVMLLNVIAMFMRYRIQLKRRGF
ncbi:MAG: phosphate ABC transporter permease PstA [Alphaproteobacteria bacterium]